MGRRATRADSNARASELASRWPNGKDERHARFRPVKSRRRNTPSARSCDKVNSAAARQAQGRGTGKCGHCRSRREMRQGTIRCERPDRRKRAAAARRA